MTRDVILVLNAGSSSLKACVVEASADLPTLATGQIASIGAGSEFIWNEQAVADAQPAPTHADASRQLFAWIDRQAANWRFRAAGHRIVHGGERYAAPTLLTPQALQNLEALQPLARLHQPNCLAAVHALAERHPALTQIGCFDTSFHHNQSPVFRAYAIPRRLRDQGIQRYGFHGLSYEWIARVLAEEHPELAQGRVVAAHLGNGSSLCALRAGNSVDTTMGMTALDGLPMGTRCGSIDPGVVLYMLRELELDADRVEQILSHESGLLGLSGVSHDVRDLLASGTDEAEFALDYFCTMTAQHVARMAVALGGLDAVAFTGGIGEHAEPVRARIVEKLGFLVPFEVLVIPANEEQMIAEHCWSYLTQQA